MNISKRKILIVGFGALVVLVVGMVLMMFLKHDKNDLKKQTKKEKKVSENQAKENIVKKSQDNEKFLRLADGPIFGLRLIKGTNQVLFYQNQKFLNADPYTGKKHSVNTYPFGKVTRFLWNANGDKAIVKDLGEYYLYDFDSNLTNKFNKKIDIAIWGSGGDKIIYKYYNPENHRRKINITDISLEDTFSIVDNLLYRKIDMINQFQTDRFCYFPVPDARVKGKLFCQDINGSNLKEYGGNYGQDYLWSPDGEKILTSFAKNENGNQLVLAVMNKNGAEGNGLAFSTTVRKCVWSKDSINVYCAMLTGDSDDIMLPNAWSNKSFKTADTFWKINTVTGKKTRLIALDEMKVEGNNILVDSENLILDPEEEFLFFVNRNDGSLWRIKIK